MKFAHGFLYFSSTTVLGKPTWEIFERVAINGACKDGVYRPHDVFDSGSKVNALFYSCKMSALFSCLENTCYSDITCCPQQLQIWPIAERMPFRGKRHPDPRSDKTVLNLGL